MLTVIFDVEMGNSCASDSDSADALGADVRLGLEAAKLGLGTRGQGLSPAEHAEAEALISGSGGT